MDQEVNDTINDAIGMNTSASQFPSDMELTVSYEECCHSIYTKAVASDMIGSAILGMFNETTEPRGHKEWALVDEFCSRKNLSVSTSACMFSSSIAIHVIDQMNILHLPVYGYILPCLGFFTLITNILVCVVLLQKHMRNPTNLLLVAMAISDLLTGIIPTPVFIHIYTLGYYKEWQSCLWAKLTDTLFLNMPTICHTASIWLTVALAFQRYLCVCHSLKAKQWCTIRNIQIAIVVIYIVAFLSQVSKFTEKTYKDIVLPSVIEPWKMVPGCEQGYSQFISNHENAYYQTYWWFRVLAVHMIPCVCLVILNAFLIVTMRAAQVRREQLMKQNRNSECRRLKETNSTTFMLVAVVGVFLLVEFPMAIFFILYILHSSFYPHLVETTAIFDIASLLMNLCILLSYPINFFIYCGMSRQFRETFKRIFRIGGSTQTYGEPSHYMSLATENGNKNCLTHETTL